MVDRNVTAAAQHFDTEEAAAEGACAAAATAHGLTADQAEQCDDGDQGCPTCPWARAGATRRRDPHEYVCGIVRDGKHLDLRLDQLTLQEVQQVLCETFDMIDALEANPSNVAQLIDNWRRSKGT